LKCKVEFAKIFEEVTHSAGTSEKGGIMTKPRGSDIQTKLPEGVNKGSGLQKRGAGTSVQNKGVRDE
jgi:hypothetical protein